VALVPMKEAVSSSQVIDQIKKKAGEKADWLVFLRGPIKTPLDSHMISWFWLQHW
jgi:hypothetical protein